MQSHSSLPFASSLGMACLCLGFSLKKTYFVAHLQGELKVVNIDPNPSGIMRSSRR